MNLSSKALEMYQDLDERIKSYQGLDQTGTEIFFGSSISETDLIAYQELYVAGLVDFEWTFESGFLHVEGRICDPTEVVRKKRGTI